MFNKCTTWHDQNREMKADASRVNYPGVLLHHACMSSTGPSKAKKFHRKLGQKCRFATTDTMAIFLHFHPQI